MISNQILQTTIDGLKGITRIDLCICDTEGKVLASTFPEAEEYENSILSFVESPGCLPVTPQKKEWNSFFCGVTGRQPGDPGISVLQGVR